MEECWSWNALLRWITNNRNKQDLGQSQADLKKWYSVRDTSEPGLAFLWEKRLIALTVKWQYSLTQRQMIYLSGDMLKGAYPGPPNSLMYKIIAPPKKNAFEYWSFLELDCLYPMSITNVFCRRNKMITIKHTLSCARKGFRDLPHLKQFQTWESAGALYVGHCHRTHVSTRT